MRAGAYALCKRLTDLLEIWFLSVGIEMTLGTGSLSIAETQPRRWLLSQQTFDHLLSHKDCSRSWRYSHGQIRYKFLAPLEPTFY